VLYIRYTFFIRYPRFDYIRHDITTTYDDRPKDLSRLGWFGLGWEWELRAFSGVFLETFRSCICT